MEATIDIRTADGNVNVLLDEKQIGSMREVLVDLCLSTMAQFAMLIDAAGRVVAAGGETKGVQIEAIAALSAADLATSRQLAGILDEPEFSLLFQHEKQKNLFMTAIGSDAILIVVFDINTTFGALRLRIRRSISQLQQILHQAKRNTVISLSSMSEVSAVADMDSTAAPARPAPPVAAAAAPAPAAPSMAAPSMAAPPPGAPAALRPPSPPAATPPAPDIRLAAGGIPPELAGEIRKVLDWFDKFQGWKIVFSDEVVYLARGVERGQSGEADTIRTVFLRTRARLTEQKRLLEARFRMIQSLYQQLVVVLQSVMQGVWNEEIVDRAMRAAFSSVGQDHNLVGAGVQKGAGGWGFDFGVMGRQLVAVCHARKWTYHQGMVEILHQLNAALSALSAFVVEQPRLQEELTRQWARLYKHYSEGLKTLDLEATVLDLFRPLVRPGQLPQ